MFGKLGLVAGAGDLPRRVLDACRLSGRPAFVIAIEGQAAPDLVADVPHAWIRLGSAASAVHILRREGISQVVLAGAVRRPSLTAMRPDLATLRFMTAAAARGVHGDDALLRAVVAAIEAEGFEVMAAENIAGPLFAPDGPLGRLHPDAVAWGDIRRGVAVLSALGPVDVGQAVIVQQGIVLTVEAAEGTDRMITRSGALRQPGPAPVLVKMTKPGQEGRVDRPVIGPVTVREAATAGIRGIAIEAGATLVVDLASVTAAANEAGLFVVGVTLPFPEG